MMNCRRATRLMSDARERKLSFGERAGLKLHTAICAGCRNFGRQMRILGKISRAYTQKPEPGEDESD